MSTMPRHAATEPARRRNEPKQRTLLASMVAGGLFLAGCAATPTAWRMEPTMRVEHTQGTNVAQGFVALARQYEGERRLPQALDAWRKASAAAPYDTDVLNSLGMAEAFDGGAERAVEVLRIAVALSPRQASLHNNLGYALYLTGQSVESAEVLRQALALDPGYGKAKLNLARVEAAAAAVIAAAATPPIAATVTGAAAEAPPAAAPLIATAEVLPTAAPAPVVMPANVATVAQAQASRLQTTPNLAALRVSHDAATSAAQRLQHEQPQAPAARQVMTDPTPLPKTPAAVPVPTQVAAIASAVDGRLAARPAQNLEESKPQPARSMSLPEPERTVATTAATTSARAGLKLEVSNGNGVEGMAARVRAFLRANGMVEEVRLTNMADFQSPVTVVQYREGFKADAQAVANGLPHPAVVAHAPSKLARGDVRVVLGHDIRTAATAMPIAS